MASDEANEQLVPLYRHLESVARSLPDDRPDRQVVGT